VWWLGSGRGSLRGACSPCVDRSVAVGVALTASDTSHPGSSTSPPPASPPSSPDISQKTGLRAVVTRPPHASSTFAQLNPQIDQIVCPSSAELGSRARSKRSIPACGPEHASRLQPGIRDAPSRGTLSGRLRRVSLSHASDGVSRGVLGDAWR